MIGGDGGGAMCAPHSRGTSNQGDEIMKGKSMMWPWRCSGAPALAGAVTEKDFEVKTTQNLIDLCTAPVRDPLYNQAITSVTFPGRAYQYYAAAAAGPRDQARLFPREEPPPATVHRHVRRVAKAHPQYMGEKPGTLSSGS
jgi:hypothetical protein